MVGTDFLLAGRAIFTVSLPADFSARLGLKPHYTYQIELEPGKPGTRYSKDSWFVRLLTGPNNEQDYTYVGKLRPATGEVMLTSNSRYAESSWVVLILRRVLARIWAHEGDLIEKAGWRVCHEGCCGRCGRTLTTPESVERGIGPECLKRMSA